MRLAGSLILRPILATVAALALLPSCARKAPPATRATTAPAVATAPAAAATRPASLQARLDEALGRLAHTGAIYSARVIDLSTGRVLYDRDADRPMIPASNMKLPVGAAALDILGADHRFRTWLAFDGHDLHLVGTGDPATGDPRLAAARRPGGKPTDVLDAFADALLKRGVRRVPGRLLYHDAALDDQRVHPSWSRSFLTDWYAAPVASLNFNDNCIDVVAIPAEPGKPARLEVMPPTAGVRVVNRLVSAATLPARIERQRDADVFTLGGGVTKRTVLESKPVTDPPAFFADALRTHLASRGISIAGATAPATGAPFPAAGLAPPADIVVAVHETPMEDVLMRLNKNSQNLFAEAVCKVAGAAHASRAASRPATQPIRGSWTLGDAAVRDFLRRQGIDDSGFTLVDGSGLARGNRVTARLLTDLLAAMDRHPAAALFRRSLPVAGRDGTLARRMKDIEGQVQAKTGYIGGVRTLSGYARSASGRTLAFSILYNRIPGEVKPFEALQDEACRILVAWDEREAAGP